jgi:hypothetical protein
MDEQFEALVRAFRDCLPGPWLAGDMHVVRVPRPGGDDTLRVTITNTKGRRSSQGPSEALLRELDGFLASAPADWTSYHLKAKRKREGGWDAHGEFRSDEAERAAAAAEGAPGGDWVANSRQTYFGARYLGTYTRLCVRKKRKGGWVLEESRWVLFIPLGTETTKLGACDRISTYWDSNSRKHVVELEAVGRPGTRVYEGTSRARKDWLVETLQTLLCVPVAETKVFYTRG